MNSYTLHITLYDLFFFGMIFIGLTFALLLAFVKSINRTANQILGLALVTMILWMVRILAIDIMLETYVPGWDRLPMQFLLALGPLIYFYVLKITRPEYKFIRTDLLHLSPLLLEQSILLLEIKESTRTGVPTYATTAFQLLHPALELLIFISVIAYLHQSHKLIQNFYRRLQPVLMDRSRLEFRWLTRLLAATAFLWFLWLAYAAVDYFGYRNQLGIHVYYPFYIFFVVIIIWTAMAAFLRPQAGVMIKPSPSFKPSAPTELREKGAWLKKQMEASRYYQDPELSLGALAEKLDLTTHELSRIVNQTFKKSFSDLINEYRVSDVVRKMQDPAYSHITLLGVAYGSGFNSKTTFNRAFKQVTGKNPVDYKNELKKEAPFYNAGRSNRFAAVISNQETNTNWAPEKLNRNYMFRNYLKIAWRNIVKNKTYSALNVAGLTIGVIVCLLIGLWLKRELSYDNFHGNDIFRVVNTFKSESETFSQAPSGIALGAQLPRQLPAVKAACRVFNFEYKFKATESQFFEANSSIVDSNYFSFFGFHLKLGQPGQVLNASNKLVLSENMAIKYFGTEKDIIGKTILMDNQPMIVSGIAENPPVNSHLQCEIFVPYAYFRNWAIKNWKADPDDQWVGGWPYTYVKLGNPQDWQKTEAQINQIAARFSDKDWKANNMSYHYFLQPIADIHLKSHLRYDAANNGNGSEVNIFSIVGIIVLLLACINYINLTTAGAIKRVKETLVRKVVGATQVQLVRQFFLETVIVCTLAVLLGVAIVKVLLPAFSTFIGQSYYFPLSFATIFFIFGFIVVLSVIAGIYPSLILSSLNPAKSLKGSFIKSKSGDVIRKGLVIVQFTITIALIASILIITQQMDFVKNKSLGFNSSAVIEVNFNGDDNVVKRYSSIKNELLKDPHILSVARHDANVIGGLGNGWTTTQTLQGKEVSTSIYRLNVDPDYFKTYNLKLSAGRFFSYEIPTDSSKSVLINESAVKTFGWQNAENAIGKPFGKGNKKRYVVGVVKDFNFESLHKPVDALLIGYISGGNRLSVKIDAAHMEEAIGRLKEIWKEKASEVPLQYSFVDERIAQQYGSEQKMESIFYGFSGLSLVIACFGLFGLSMFVVERKVKEIGIRKVLGSSISGIISLLSKDFLLLVLISLLIASPLAWYFMNNWLNDFAFRINISAWVFLEAGTTALLIAGLTISFQSIKAALANPVKSLRSE